MKCLKRLYVVGEVYCKLHVYSYRSLDDCDNQSDIVKATVLLRCRRQLLQIYQVSQIIVLAILSPKILASSVAPQSNRSLAQPLQ